MTFAVVGGRREKSPAVGVNIKTEFAQRWNQLAYELVLVIVMYDLIKRAEISFDRSVNRLQNVIDAVACRLGRYVA
jgi:hypothetical protein